MAFRKKYWIKYFNHSLPPNQQDRERDWVYHWLMILLKSTWWELKVETKEGEGSEFIIQLPAKPHFNEKSIFSSAVCTIVWFGIKSKCPGLYI